MRTPPQTSPKPAQTVQKGLARYRAMRDFQITSEPRGTSKARSSAALPFVIQKHAATRLHYDFRIAWRGVLKSWAVTKGPSFYPGDKRLAVQVEDHPLEYGSFEGTIPRGQYGGGTVMVWDFGDWTPLGDVDQGLAEGHLKFELHGKKLKGRWALVRMHGGRQNSGKPNWLLIKDRDRFARSSSGHAITDDAPNSAKTRRSIEQIAASGDAVWESTNGSPHETARQANAPGRPLRKFSENDSRQLTGAHEKFPGFIPPQLARQAAVPPHGAGWIHELKLDGYRIQVHIRSQRQRTGVRRWATLLTRKGLDWSARMPALAMAAAQLPVDDAILDGEVVALNSRGQANFADLQAAFQEGRQKTLVYFAFDLLHLNGHNPRALPLLQRKELLADLFSRARQDSLLRFSEHFHEEGSEVFAHACRLGAEGIVSKLADGRYIPGRGNTWLKIKCAQQQEFVIGGFTLPSKGGHGIGALLLGYYHHGKLQYAGRTGTGFTEKTRRTLRNQLDALLQTEPAFAKVPASAGRGVKWVKPKLVAQVAFATWTRDDLVRQASFKGLRDDKPPKEIVREFPDALEAALPRRTAQRKNSALRRTASEKDDPMPTQLPITHPDKVLDPESGMTKRTLAEYYIAVAARMLPHISGRPLSVVRCPEGSTRPCFFQKHVGHGLPSGVESIPVRNPKTGATEDFLTLETVDGLVGMAQMGVLEIHPWGSRNSALDQPDRIVFDLDPDPAIDWSTLAACVAELRQRLKEFKLACYLKSTGGKGLHLVVPIEAELEWPAAKRFAHAVTLKMEAEQPALYITKMSKAQRKGRIFLDYLRNDREATSIAPYSPRARSGIPVAMPLAWKELESATRPAFHVADIEQWRARLTHDPWKTMATAQQRLTKEILRAAGAADAATSMRG